MLLQLKFNVFSKCTPAYCSLYLPVCRINLGLKLPLYFIHHHIYDNDMRKLYEKFIHSAAKIFIVRSYFLGKNSSRCTITTASTLCIVHEQSLGTIPENKIISYADDTTLKWVQEWNCLRYHFRCPNNGSKLNTNRSHKICVRKISLSNFYHTQSKIYC